MKKLFLLFGLFMGLTVQLLAQDLSFGPKAGIHVSTIDGDTNDFEPKIGATFGGFGKVSLSENFSFQPELHYAMFGAEASDSEEDLIRLNQIVVPLTINFFPGFNGNEEGLKIGLGPQIGFIIKDEIESAGETEDFSDIIETFPTQDFSSTDIGGLLRLGYEFSNGLWLEGNGYRSLTPVFQINDEKNFDMAGAFTIGYNIAYNKGF